MQQDPMDQLVGQMKAALSTSPIWCVGQASEANKLAGMCRSALAAVRTLPVSMQVQFRFFMPRVASGWELRVEFDPVCWYDYVLGVRGINERDSVIALARAFVDKTRQEAAEVPDPVPQENCRPLDAYCWDPNCKYHRNGGRCNFGLPTPKPCCQSQINLVGGFTRPCNFYTNPQLTVKSCDKDIVCLARSQEATRELLVIANPSLFQPSSATINVPHTNAEALSTKKFWSLLLKQVELIDKHARPTTTTTSTVSATSAATETSAVCSMSANFGRWESLQHRDEKALDCHCHVHVHLTIPGRLALARQKDFEALTGREGNPQDYMHANCALLEKDRLLGAEMADVKTRVTNLQTTVGNLQTTVNTLQTTVDALQTLMLNMGRQLDVVAQRLDCGQ